MNLFSGRFRTPSGLCFSLLSLGLLFLASAPLAGQTQAVSTAGVPLFDAIAAEQIAVRIIPSDSTSLTMHVENKTKQPLAIQIPAGLAAAPVLAQQPFGFNNFNNNNNNNNGNSNQAVGLNGPNNNNNQNGLMNGFFNVPAERTLKIKLPCVCLEHGKPDPNPRVKYEVVPLERYSQDPRVITTLAALGKELDQRSAQLAVWHIVNQKSWGELAALKIKHVDGFSTPQFTKKELELAERWVAKLPKETVAVRSAAGR